MWFAELAHAALHEQTTLFHFTTTGAPPYTMYHKDTCTPQTPTNTCTQFNANPSPSPYVQSTRAMEHMLEVPESQRVSTGQNSMTMERRENGQGRLLGAFVSVTATVDHRAAMYDALIQTLILVTFLTIWLVSTKCTKH